jgi:hypothetical protein
MWLLYGDQKRTGTNGETHPKKHLLVRVTFDVDTFQRDYTNFFLLIGVGVDVKVWSWAYVMSRQIDET